MTFSESADMHFVHLRIVLEKFRAAGITLNLKKSSIVRREVVFLGYILSGDGIKINALVNFRYLEV